MRHLDLPATADMHLHLRQGDMLTRIALQSAKQCHAVLVMPNIKPSIKNTQEALAYKAECQKYLQNVNILTTIKFLPSTTPEQIIKAAKCGVNAVKLYPAGVTTNSEDGISGEMLLSPTRQFLDCIEAIRKSRMTLCLHGEMPGVGVLEREVYFLDFMDFLCFNFPKLRVVLEHISTERQVDYVDFVNKYSKINLAATITAHHLWLTLDDVIGDCINPHNFCKPVPKKEHDRDALRAAATSGKPYFFLGSDSAPHEVRHKETEHGCAGIYSAPLLTESVITIFEEMDAIDKLPGFINHFGCDYYKIDRGNTKRRYERTQWQIPIFIDRIKPFLAGKSLEWKLDECY